MPDYLRWQRTWRSSAVNLQNCQTNRSINSQGGTLAVGLHSRRLPEETDRLVSSAPILRLFDPNLTITITVDASSYGVAAALIQEGRPVWRMPQKPCQRLNKDTHNRERNACSPIWTWEVPSIRFGAKCHSGDRPGATTKRWQETTKRSITTSPKDETEMTPLWLEPGVPSWQGHGTSRYTKETPATTA